MRRAVILFPSGLTLGNLFFGVFAIITASRGDFRKAGIFVLLGGICDALDGRVARATNAGSQFGEELDSLVDAISFGLAPAMIMYFAVLNRDGWDWIFVFLFASAAVMRLARFNIEQAGTAKTYFQGLPSPAAGCTLASYYWFSQSWLYNYGAIGDLPWQEMLRFLMAALAALMISNVPYPAFPRTGFRSLRALGASLLVLSAVALLATKRLEFFFPLTLVYVAWGLIRWIFFGLFERRQPTIPFDLSEGEDDGETDIEEDFEVGSSQVHASRQGHRATRALRDDRPIKPRPRDEADDRQRTEQLPQMGDRPDRKERADRPVRPQRTEAERADRLAKREKREKRERSDRGPHVAGGDRLTAEPTVAGGATAITVGETSGGAPVENEVIGRIPGGAEPVALTGGTEGAATRKRKRRRRRGERKERTPSEGGAATSADTGEGGGMEDMSNDADANSPYSAPAAAPPEPRLVQPPPIPASSTEPHE